jgi:hypothetical protein
MMTEKRVPFPARRTGIETHSPRDLFERLWFKHRNRAESRIGWHIPGRLRGQVICPTGKSPARFIDPSVNPVLKKYSDFQKARLALHS